MSSDQPLLLAGCWQPSMDATNVFRAEDPQQGVAIGPEFPVSGQIDLEAALAAGQEAAAELSAASPAQVADFLATYADALAGDAETLSNLAHAETALPKTPRLVQVELPRTVGQLREAAQAVRACSWTHPVIDTEAGLRSHLAPLGKPVLVMGPNNFPFAFNAVAGSDFASAIAARNPVIAKGHPSHPATTRRMAELAHHALATAGLPAGTLQLLYHFDHALGQRVAADRRLGAIAFTGSRQAGLALKAAADPAGVPVFAELSSLNPVFLLPGALAERGGDIANEFASSCMLGSGQFCTNPGLVVAPRGRHGDDFVDQASQLFGQADPMVLFSRGVLDELEASVEQLRAAGASLICGGHSGTPGYRFVPTLMSVDGERFLADSEQLQAEAFGPVSLLVRVSDMEQALAIAEVLEGNLTAAIYRGGDGADDDHWKKLAARLRPRVGRLINSHMPTGVAVSAAQNHGGPYPSTTSVHHTAVGMPAAITRFAALHCYDDVADDLLPVELRDRNPGGVQRLIDGHWTTADIEPRR
ncbi:aldehyde dehydrogenase family protein [Wenzhouxiangella sp. AB-CW3]|uniref:aldehyde dehydrogenase family protein n=1 Tax=Wenzhouxiangella sp. AB-CW3 TaxID=2771012 RepID=UPI00168B1724|nr:aldehyde dehydrogenase family protein [Wenzhouxiangella sp. AB-CW3]QOC21966.1 aldehyde dehydrogenase family protein [Wenzhouxiangella sp. AB-CW3]